VVGLLVVEFIEDSGGKGGVFSDEGGEFMVGRGRGVDGQVGVA